MAKTQGFCEFSRGIFRMFQLWSCIANCKVLFRVPGWNPGKGVEPWGSLRIAFGKIGVHLRED